MVCPLGSPPHRLFCRSSTVFGGRPQPESTRGPRCRALCDARPGHPGGGDVPGRRPRPLRAGWRTWKAACDETKNPPGQFITLQFRPAPEKKMLTTPPHLTPYALAQAPCFEEALQRCLRSSHVTKGVLAREAGKPSSDPEALEVRGVLTPSPVFHSPQSRPDAARWAAARRHCGILAQRP